MRIIPVLDLIAGQVVRARFGDRASYRPIETHLAPTADPRDVAAGLMRLHPFDTIYIADLDGIEGRAPNDHVVDDLARRWPGLSLWVDNGIADADTAAGWLDAHRARLVVGSESQRSTSVLKNLGDRAVLSIDWRGDAYVGPPDVLADPGVWPADVIAMTLARVGSGAGPDVQRLADLHALAGPGRRLYAAGGVRHLDDLLALARAGIAGALVSTALHDGQLDPEALWAAAAL